MILGLDGAPCDREFFALVDNFVLEIEKAHAAEMLQVIRNVDMISRRAKITFYTAVYITIRDNALSFAVDANGACHKCALCKMVDYVLGTAPRQAEVS